MKRKLYVPIMLSNINDQNRGEYVRRFKEVSADFVFIAIKRDDIFSIDEQYRKDTAAALKKHLEYFTSQGFEVGVWISVLGYGGADLSPKDSNRTANMTRIKSITGTIGRDAFCPEDPIFMEMYCEYVKEIINAGTKVLMLDDDFCLSVRPGIGCFCDRHIKLLEEKLGEKLNHETLCEDFFTGAANRYRRAFLDVMGESMRKFCRTVRQTVDSIDPDVRIGFCTGYTSWDLEGADALELAKILAGKTKPFLRFTGAPYWVAPNRTRFKGQRLHAVIDFARIQEKWCENTGIEYFSEGDTFPRPRFQIPANFVECFDAAMVASNNTPVLKYLFDYVATIDYETGYQRLHLKNLPLYNFLEQNFGDKISHGIEINEKMRKYDNMTLPVNFDESDTMYYSLPCAAPFLTQLGVPVTFEDSAECEIAFGDNFNALTAKNVILDLNSALKLKENGVDVGIEEITESGKDWAPAFEISGQCETRIEKGSGRYYEDCKLNKKAKVLSYFELHDKKLPAAIEYNNGETRFLIFMFDAYSLNPSSGVFCSYIRQKQITDFYSDYPVVGKNPFVYQIFKKNETETALFFANIFEDPMWDFEIKLDRAYSKVTSCGADVELVNGNVLKVTSTVSPFGMFAVKLS